MSEKQGKSLGIDRSEAVSLIVSNLFKGKEELRRALGSFEISPIVSSIKVDGKGVYEFIFLLKLSDNSYVKAPDDKGLKVIATLNEQEGFEAGFIDVEIFWLIVTPKSLNPLIKKIRNNVLLQVKSLNLSNG